MKKIIKTTFANIYEKPSFQSQVVTQGIMWEIVEVLDKKNDWIKLKLPDEYIGWTQNFFLIDVNTEFLKQLETMEFVTIHQPFTAIYSDDKLKNKFSNAALSVRFPIIGKNKNLFKIYLPNKNIGYLTQEPIAKNNIRKNIITIAKSILGTSYQWGGKTEYGIDCSGFTQIIFSILNIFLPRDASQQIKIMNNNPLNLNEAKLGDLLFFKNENNNIVHVAIMLETPHFIHSSGEVKINSLSEKDDDFSAKLLNMLKGIYSIENLLQPYS